MNTSAADRLREDQAGTIDGTRCTDASSTCADVDRHGAIVAGGPFLASRRGLILASVKAGPYSFTVNADYGAEVLECAGVASCSYVRELEGRESFEIDVLP